MHRRNCNVYYQGRYALFIGIIHSSVPVSRFSVEVIDIEPTRTIIPVLFLLWHVVWLLYEFENIFKIAVSFSMFHFLSVSNLKMMVTWKTKNKTGYLSARYILATSVFILLLCQTKHLAWPTLIKHTYIEEKSSCKKSCQTSYLIKIVKMAPILFLLPQKFQNIWRCKYFGYKMSPPSILMCTQRLKVYLLFHTAKLAYILTVGITRNKNIFLPEEGILNVCLETGAAMSW